MIPNLLIIGAGGHARVVVDILQSVNELSRLCGFIDAYLPIGESPKGCEQKVVGGDEDLSEYKGCEFVIGIGSIRGGTPLREKLFQKALEAGLKPATLVHSTAILAKDVILGDGTVVMAGVVVNTGVRTGVNVILNTRCVLDHDITVADHAHIAPGAVMSGDCRIGENALIGTGATLRQGISVADNATVAAGAVVVKDVAEGALVVGVPAKVLK